MNTYRVGHEGEEQACEYLRSHGMKILARNYRYGREEIDIVARDGKTVVFIEVKYRANDRFGLPAEAVTVSKRRAIVHTAIAYLKQNGLLESSVRFDVAAIREDEINYIKNAFDATGLIR